MAAAQRHPTDSQVFVGEGPPIPTPDEYRAVADRFQRGFDEIEAMAWRLNAVHERLEEREARATEAPELAHIGALFSFIDDIEGQLLQCFKQLNTLKRLNGDLNNDRIQAEVDQRAPQ